METNITHFPECDQDHVRYFPTVSSGPGLGQKILCIVQLPSPISRFVISLRGWGYWVLQITVHECCRATRVMLNFPRTEVRMRRLADRCRAVLQTLFCSANLWFSASRTTWQPLRTWGLWKFWSTRIFFECRYSVCTHMCAKKLNVCNVRLCISSLYYHSNSSSSLWLWV